MTGAAMAAAVALALTACQMPPPGTGAGAGLPRRVTLVQSGLSVEGPAGFCVDTASVRDTAEGGFVLLAQCTRATGGGGPALLTLSVSPPLAAPGAFAPARLAEFFATAEGRAVLSRAGRADTVRVLESRSGEGAFLLHARDTAPPPIAGLDDDYWRVLFVLDGRLMTATATGFEATPVSAGALKALLARFRIALERANPV
ncbi:hypothetical protein [Celeribacter indicus]|uniref:Cation transport ATPase n=2 Tax=Celeribacter indicus TaxID=1208324 RepID=A0A0B5DYI3_9RHOB|nr:hypothetical protein [Celeribacter indicus]AJE45257.1 hypothetical protein P73_0542 [Celeribacter indicus]